MKIKSHPTPVADFDSNSKSVKSNKRVYSKNIIVKTAQIINKCI